jgi:hypothetical protein
MVSKMASFKSFKDQRNKKNDDIYKKRNNVNKTNDTKSKDQRLRDGIKLWAGFYRSNVHRFVMDYLGIKLHLFQIILLYMMNTNSFFMYLAARGQGKSFIIAIYCIARAILYPGSKIILASGTKGQARLIITQKIDKELKLKFPNLAREIKEIKTGQNECVVIFQNGSTIEAVTSTDSARGYRGNILVLDEFRLIKEENLNKILRPFLNVNRQPPYLMKPEYAHLQEDNVELYISSAWYKNHWMWDKFNSFKNSMIEGRSYFACAFPYQLSVHHGLLSKKRVEEMRQEDDFDEIVWMMEMDCLFFGENENAFFKLDDLTKCRSMVKPFYPTNTLDVVTKKKKKNEQDMPKQNGEIRIIGMDVALMGGAENDQTVFTLMRLLPNGTIYQKQVPYIETLNGEHSEKQAIRLKQLYYDFEADYVVMDTMGNGLSVYDDCTRILYDEERDIEFPSWCAFNDEEMKKRALDKNALPIIFSMKVSKAELNHEIAVNLRGALEKRQIKLLIDDIQGRDYLIEKQGYLSKNSYEQAQMIKPYVQTTALVNEMVNLEYEVRNGFVKVKERGRNRKDRYSSLAYANYLARYLESKNLKPKEESGNANQFFLFKKPKIR